MDKPPHAVGPSSRLSREKLGGVVTVETEEISQLGGCIDLGLPDILALAQHRGGDELIAVPCRGKLGCPLENSRPIDKRGLLPPLLCLQGGFDGSRDLLFASEREVGKDLLVF